MILWTLILVTFGGTDAASRVEPIRDIPTQAACLAAGNALTREHAQPYDKFFCVPQKVHP